ncbi:MAG TPA: nitrilase-related carbon-nitrogen hydrolase, partial [Streptosporangiaceae bacterium]|nr:nitrilase-related carbon-nitrogen hydrolase [Streptosporangiaceae bacterium]
MTCIVAVAQLALQVGDVAGNRRKAREAAAQAARQGASLLILPELADSGYVFASAEEARHLAEPAGNNATLREWRELAVELSLAIVGGFCELGGDGLLYNSAALVDAEGTRAVYRKAHPWDAEKRIFTPGDARPPVVDLGFGRIGLVICYDLEFPEWVRLPALAGADLIAAPVNWPAPAQAAGERPAEVIKAQAAAAINGVFVAVADRCAAERGVRWISGSMIIAPGGQAVAGPVLADQPALLTAACDLTAARDKRVSENNDLFADRRPALYGLGPAVDARVAAAKAHWAPRFIANGTDYADYETTMRRITRWAYWCEGWGETARRYELIASESERAAKTQTATDAWRRAALCWHWAKFVFTDDPVQQRAA